MKNYQLKVKGTARRDLAQLASYLKRKFGNRVAKRVIADLRKSMKQLENFPGLGRDASELSEFLSGYNYLHLKRSTVFYKVYDDEGLVRVLHVYGNNMDIISRLLDELGIDDEQ